MAELTPAKYNDSVGVSCPVYANTKKGVYMVSGHLEIKRGYYYVVLSYLDVNGKRH